jgi:hypothetical protein
MTSSMWAAFFGAVAVLAFGCAGAQARIVCREGFQIVDGQALSTPYCNDAYVAEVVRAHGRDVSDDAVRENPALKDEVCRQFGSDIRIKHYCDTDNGHDGSH